MLDLNRQNIRRLFLAAALLAGSQAGNAADSALDHLRAFLSEVKSLEATFDQTLYDESHEPLEESGGQFYLQRPDRFRWSYTRPYPQEIVADGKRLWVYDSELAQVTVKPMDQALGNTPSLLLSSAEPLENSFVLRDAGYQDGLDWVELSPRSAESNFIHVRLGFAGKDLKTMELKDSFGQTTRMDFSGAKINPSLDPALFRFTLPTGADVITSGES